MKVVYLYDGKPFLVMVNNEGEYVYPDESWTQIAPPEGIYEPFYFDGNKWIGATKEEWESNLPPTDRDDIDKKDEAIAHLTIQLLNYENKFEMLQKDVALLTLNVLGGETNA